MRFFKPMGLVAAAWTMCGVDAMAATTVFRQGATPDPTYQTGDSTIRSDQASNNYGRGTYVITGRTSGGVIRSAFSFSLADIPAGSTITSVSLTLTGERTDNDSANEAVALELYRLTTGFEEGASDVNGANGDGSGVTWNRSAAGSNWTAGGSFSTLLSSVSANPRSNAGVVSTFATSLDFVAAAQAALDAGQDLSMLLKLGSSNESVTTRRAFFFYAGEETSDTVDRSGVRPGLSVTYVIPEPTTALLAAMGSLALLRRRRA
ncbi:MAG: PEP-CTERM sorting domain-containing protein [Verrucomicrobiaceae bacterium]|nr:MAG: PEP-CTERM sorting domain-containing protein [Verrucomicrobiaceae bacterium]